MSLIFLTSDWLSPAVRSDSPGFTFVPSVTVFSSGLSRVEGERGHREVPVHAVRGGQHPDGVAQLDALDAPVHHVEVDGLARQAEVLVLDVGQVLLAFGLEVRRYRHVVEVHGLRDDPEVPDSRSRLEVDLVRVDRLDGGVLLQRLDAALLEPRAERDDPGGDLGGVHVLGVVEQVLPNSITCVFVLP